VRERGGEDRGDDEPEILAHAELHRGGDAHHGPQARDDEEPGGHRALREEQYAEGEDGRGAGGDAEHGRARVRVARRDPEERVQHHRVSDEGEAHDGVRRIGPAEGEPPPQADPGEEGGLDQEGDGEDPRQRVRRRERPRAPEDGRDELRLQPVHVEVMEAVQKWANHSLRLVTGLHVVSQPLEG
jgi:hypothetical protein